MINRKTQTLINVRVFLLSLFQDRNMNDFEIEYENVLPLIKNICFKYRNNGLVELEDMVQEASIKIWEASKDFNMDCKFSSFVYKIVNNYCMDVLRKTYRKRRIRTIGFDDSIFNMASEDNSLKQEQLKLMTDAIKRMEEVDRILIEGCFNRTPHKLLSSQLGLTESNVKVKIHRIKKKLHCIAA